MSRVVVALLFLLLVPALSCGEDETTGTLKLRFEGARALAHVETQLSFGPRVPGTDGHRQQQVWMEKEMQQLGWKTEWHHVPSWTPTLLQKPVPVHNLIARLYPERPKKLFFSAHYDTRPISDFGRTIRERNTAIPGANDGGSGVAVLLEMARILAANPPANYGIIIVFHDCEDLGVRENDTSNDPTREFAMGARFLADAWKVEDAFEAGINLDMVGERTGEGNYPLYQPEGYSLQRQPALVREFWDIANELFPDNFLHQPVGFVMDDHLPYLFKDMPCINLIDLDFPQWHTPSDDLSAVSADTMQMVGMTVLEFVYQRDRKAGEKP